MSITNWLLTIIIIIISFFFICKNIWYYLKFFHYKLKTLNLRFLLIKIPRKDSDLDQKNDTIQNMKQNIEVMNQVIKNFYAVCTTNYIDKYLGQNFVCLEILVEKEVIKYILSVDEEYVESFEKIISSFYPGAVVDIIPQPKLLDAGKHFYGGQFILIKDSPFPIKTYEKFEADPMDSLLSGFARVNWEEKVCLQILAVPLFEHWQKDLRKDIKRIKEGKNISIRQSIKFGFIKLLEGMEEKKQDTEAKHGLSNTQIQDIEHKAEDEGFEIVMRAIAVSPQPHRAEKLIEDLVRCFNQYNYIGLNSLFFLPFKNANNFIEYFIMKLFTRPMFTWKRKIFFIKNQILNIKELASIFHFPHFRFNKNPNLKWQNYKIKPAPEELPKDGISIGYNLYSGVKKEIKIQDVDRLRHLYLIGQTGTGKTTMLYIMAKQDALNGNGFCFIDPHGDFCEHLLSNYPKERIDSLIYFNGGDYDMPIGFNVFEAQTEEEKDIITTDLVETFIQMYGPEIFGPRIQDYFTNGALTLMEQPDGGTLVELVRLFTDEAYQKIKLKNVKNPVVRAWWEKTFKAMGEREKGEMIPFFQAKFGPFITTPILRNIIGQSKSSFSIFDAMQTKKVIILNISKGTMGERNSSLLGSLLVTQMKVCALRRGQMPENQRTPFYLYIDEFQNFINPSISTILSEARKYKLGLNIAHQYIDQLVVKGLGGEVDLRPAIFGNVGTKIAYNVSAKDAEYLEQEFSPDFSRTDLVNIDKHKGIIKLSVNTQPSRPFSISVNNPYKDVLNTPEKVKLFKEISRLKWGRKKDLVEKEIFYRVGA